VSGPDDRFEDGSPANLYELPVGKQSKKAKANKSVSRDLEIAELGLHLDKEGEPVSSLPNVISVLSRHRHWQGVIAYDEFAEEVVTLMPPPVRPADRPEKHEAGDWSDEDSARTVAWIAGEFGFAPRLEYIEQAVRVVARKRMFHPVREYLAGLAWDRVPRLDTWLATYFGAQQTPYSAGVGSRWLISAVARVLEPGCKVDCLIVLEGLQGIKKSSAILELMHDQAWFADTTLDLGNKDSYQNLRRVWVYEMQELASLKGAMIEKSKSFISARTDRYRPSYGKRSRIFPRQTVFAGTTNAGQYLADETGARRFWPIKCVEVDLMAIRRDRDQLWAEATARYRLGEPWYVDTPEFRGLCEEEQAERQIDNPQADMLAAWLKDPKIKHAHDTATPLYPDQGLLPHEILQGYLGMQPKDINPKGQASQSIGHQMAKEGWERLRRLKTHDARRPYAYFPPGTLEARNAKPVLGDW
jgi:putative DNA primase/helicase